MRGGESKVRRKREREGELDGEKVRGALLPNSGPCLGAHGSVCLRNCTAVLLLF